MTHPMAFREQAAALRAEGKSEREIAAAIGVSCGTVHTWLAKLPEQVIEQTQAPFRQRAGEAFLEAAIKCTTRTLELLPHQDSVRETAYGARVLLQNAALALGWDAEAKAPQGNTYIDARTQSIALPAGMTVEDVRALARSRAGER